MAMNLVQHRSGPSVWDRVDREMNWDTERWILSAMAATALVMGARRRSYGGLALSLGGAALAWWAAAGADERGQVRGQLHARVSRTAHTADVIGEASEESFPASDAPSWTPSTGNKGPAANQQFH